MEQTLWLAALMLGCAMSAGFILLIIAELLQMRSQQRQCDAEEADRELVRLQEYRDMPDR
jgi:hypothetical protein